MEKSIAHKLGQAEAVLEILQTRIESMKKFPYSDIEDMQDWLQVQVDFIEKNKEEIKL